MQFNHINFCLQMNFYYFKVIKIIFRCFFPPRVLIMGIQGRVTIFSPGFIDRWDERCRSGSCSSTCDLIQSPEQKLTTTHHVTALFCPRAVYFTRINGWTVSLIVLLTKARDTKSRPIFLRASIWKRQFSNRTLQKRRFLNEDFEYVLLIGWIIVI